MSDELLRILESQSSVNDRYRELQRIKFSPGGGGAHSFLVKAQCNVTKREVALKFENPFNPDRYRQECFNREAALLDKFRGQPNILQIVDGMKVFGCPFPLPSGDVIPVPFRFVAFELARFSLFEYIHQGIKYSPLRNLTYFREICKGTQRLHTNGVCHRDLKPQNCLVMNGTYVVLGDMGTAKAIDGSMAMPTALYQEPVGDLLHASPELLCALDSDNDIAFAADKYSLGAILFELFTRSQLNLHLYSIKDINNAMIQPFSHIPPEKRREVFHESIGSLEASRSLPDIVDIAPGGAVPDSIKQRLNKLYKDLCCLDYRKRTISFDWIFIELNIMGSILSAERLQTRRKRSKGRAQAIKLSLNY